MNILILGAGAYGLSLATILQKDNNVTVYSVIKEEIDNLNKTYANEKIFPNIKLSTNIKFTNDLNSSTKNIDLIIIAIPTNYLDDTLKNLVGLLNNNTKICIASKGINNQTNKFAYDIVKEILNTENISIISGPSFAIDTIKKQEIILTLSGKNIEDIKDIFPKQYVKIETTNDIIGVELCGTLKNIFACACGILEGMEKSESTKAAFLTKIITEVKELIVAFGGNEQTIFTSSGIGDIILTCTSKKSRNYTLGYLIGQNNNKEIIKQYLNNNTVEGLDALISLKQLLKEKNIKNEILDLIYDIILNGNDIKLLVKYIVE